MNIFNNELQNKINKTQLTKLFLFKPPPLRRAVLPPCDAVRNDEGRIRVYSAPKNETWL